MKIGPYEIAAPLALAPMAGVTDLPFRQLCRRMGAGIAASEMVTSDVRLWNTPKTRHRLDHRGEPEPRVVQIAGYDPVMMSEAARMNVELGAQVIDINFGCPAKKVCNRAAGSALMRDEGLVASILTAVVAAAGVPVTLKMRTGWDRDSRNAVAIARIAEDAGIAGLAVHGRTRADFFAGAAEYETVAAVKQRRPRAGVRQRRHRLRGQGLERAGTKRRRWRDDRARGPGTALDLPRTARGTRRQSRPRRLRSKRSVLSCLRTSRPFTRSTARQKVSAWRASILVGIAVSIRRSDTCQPGC